MANDLSIMNIGGVDCYEQDGTAYLKLEAVARGLGFTQEKNSVEYVRWETIDRYLRELGYSGKTRGNAFPHKLGKDESGVATSGNEDLSASACGNGAFPTSWERPDFIPENVFYRLAMKAKNETAERFQAKVADEIIPSIRRHGAYMTDNALEKALTDPDFGIRLLTELKAEREKRKALEADMEAAAPKVLFADAVSASHTTILIGELAKLLKQNGVEIGQNRLFSFLRENGYLIRRSGADFNMPTQRSMDMGLFRVKERTVSEPSGSTRITKTTLVTGKGQQYFVNLFLRQKEEA